MTKFSPELRPIYDFEISRGNQVERIDEPAGTNCPYAIVFQYPLHVAQIQNQLRLSNAVRLWHSTDPHYPRERGFFCQKTHHAISGPLPCVSGNE